MTYKHSSGHTLFTCLAVGYPNDVALEWTQSINGDVIRTTDDLQDHLSADKSVLSFDEMSFTRTGTYTCTARNGNDGELKQSASVAANVNGLCMFIIKR